MFLKKFSEVDFANEFAENLGTLNDSEGLAKDSKCEEALRELVRATELLLKCGMELEARKIGDVVLYLEEYLKSI